jgi:Ca2+-binding EF-hand superfamily protein
MKRRWLHVAFIGACASTMAAADDRAEYKRRSAERFTAMFQHADVDSDNIVSREEATGTIELEARFDDLDINRDGNITREEMMRHIEATFR